MMDVDSLSARAAGLLRGSHSSHSVTDAWRRHGPLADLQVTGVISLLAKPQVTCKTSRLLVPRRDTGGAERRSRGHDVRGEQTMVGGPTAHRGGPGENDE